VVFSRTVDRPSTTRRSQDKRLAVAIGCAAEHAPLIGYADDLKLTPELAIPVGVNCRMCPRVQCDQRAHQGLSLLTPLDENLRGATKYET
jgi:predicted transcriptional regulator